MEPTDWRLLQFIQGADFKELSDIARGKLRRSLLENQFIQPLYVWQDPEYPADIYCLDGKHRTIMLEELAAEGHQVPTMLPATFINCADRQEAAKLVLVFSSLYAHVTDDGLQAFVDQNSLDLSLMLETIDIPFLSEGLPPMELPDDLEGDGKQKPAVMRITFETPEDLENAKSDIESILKIRYPGAFFSVSCGEI